jgi:hypothetical protein
MCLRVHVGVNGVAVIHCALHRSFVRTLHQLKVALFS